MIEAILSLEAIAVTLLLAVVLEVALFLRGRQGDFEEMLLAIEAEARMTRHAIVGHATPAARDAYVITEQVRARHDGDQP